MELFTEFLTGVFADIQRLSAPYVLLQLFIIVACYLVAWVLARFIRPRLNKWLGARIEWPKWFRLFIFSIGKNFDLILFTLFTLSARAMMLATMAAPRSYFVKLAATIGLAFVAIALFSRLIQTKTLRRLFRVTAWILAAVHLLGYTDELLSLLNSLSLNMGSINLSLLAVLKFIGIILALFFVARLVNIVLHHRIAHNQEFSPSVRALLSKVTTIVVFGIATIISFQASGLDLTSFAILSGAVAFGLGFGMQKIVSNLISGILLLLDRSIKPGDVITVEDTFGWITELGARYVSVNTRDGREFLIPNEELITSQVINWTHSSDSVRLDIHFGVSYESDPREVKAKCIEAAKSVKRVQTQPNTPVCHITGFGASSVDFILRFWISDPHKGLTNVRGDVFQAVWDALQEAGIELPFPQQDVHIKSDAREMKRAVAFEDAAELLHERADES